MYEKVYIGVTAKKLDRRFEEHMECMWQGSKTLQPDIKKYGRKYLNFIFGIVQV